MEFFDVIARRGSYRGEFEQSSISQEELYRILDAGIRAPSGYNLQTATFYAVTDELLRRSLAEIFPTKAVQTAPSFSSSLPNVYTAEIITSSLKRKITPLPQKISCWRSPLPAMPESGWMA